MVQRLQWTDEMRTALMLLRTQTTYKNDNEKVAEVFNHMFASQLQQGGYTNGIFTDKIRDSWDNRHHSGRAKAWLTVDAPPKNAAEREERAAILTRIKHVAAAVDGSGDDEVDAAAGDSIRAQVSRPPRSRASGAAAEGGEIQSPNEEVNGPTVNATTATPLEMIHVKKYTEWKSGTPHASAKFFINHNADIYKFGGKVYRAVIEGKQADVMVCKHDRCAPCMKRKVDSAQLDISASPSEGLPFVHSADKEMITGTGFSFKPTSRDYNKDYPKDVWKTRVTFLDGVKREVVVCMAANCVVCSGQDAVDERVARYQPGGHLYPLMVEGEQRQAKRVNGGDGA